MQTTRGDEAFWRPGFWRWGARWPGSRRPLLKMVGAALGVLLRVALAGIGFLAYLMRDFGEAKPLGPEAVAAAQQPVDRFSPDYPIEVVAVREDSWGSDSWQEWDLRSRERPDLTYTATSLRPRRGVDDARLAVSMARERIKVLRDGKRGHSWVTSGEVREDLRRQFNDLSTQFSGPETTVDLSNHEPLDYGIQTMRVEATMAETEVHPAADGDKVAALLAWARSQQVRVEQVELVYGPDWQHATRITFFGDAIGAPDLAQRLEATLAGHSASGVQLVTPTATATQAA